MARGTVNWFNSRKVNDKRSDAAASIEEILSD